MIRVMYVVWLGLKLRNIKHRNAAWKWLVFIGETKGFWCQWYWDIFDTYPYTHACYVSDVWCLSWNVAYAKPRRWCICIVYTTQFNNWCRNEPSFFPKSWGGVRTSQCCHVWTCMTRPYPWVKDGFWCSLDKCLGGTLEFSVRSGSIFLYILNVWRAELVVVVVVVVVVVGCCWLVFFWQKICYFLQFVLLWIPKIVESPKVTADRQAFLLQHEVGRKFLEAALLKSHVMEEERFISFFAEVCLKVIYRYISCMTYGRNELFIIYTNNMTG